MADPKAQAQTQLRNIEASSGMSVAEFVEAIRSAGLEKHGKIVAFLKSTHGLTHGNANLMAHTVRQSLAGGPPPEEALLLAQYAKAKAPLFPIYEKVAALALAQGSDVERVIQKTGVSFRRKRQFLLVQAPSSKRIQLGLNLDGTPDDPRIAPARGMCTHRVDLTHINEVDDDLASWLEAAYERAG